MDKFIQQMKKIRKRNAILFVLWYVVMLLIYCSSSDANLTTLSLVNLGAVIALVGAEFSSQSTLIAALNLLKETPDSTPEPDTEETQDS
ncbi:hypothetical protein F1728_18030 [Gimesia benthica]|uniref:Uncharacterized protein n=1 Tax=Gimesia benthica TaxID=2608982 RepID=A0A6I6AFX0_9PLAN|nr:hypothetical protein [Gimesia benthica]QGQ24472.1 hypothetical protein F1728_18030 [Gimesia benthica]